MRISDWSSDVCSSDLPLAHPHPAARHGCNRVGQSPAPAVVQRAGWAEHDLPRQLCLCRIGHEAQRTQIDAKLLIETAHQLQRAVQPYRLPITGELGRASWRERVCQYVQIQEGAVHYKKKKPNT